MSETKRTLVLKTDWLRRGDHAIVFGAGGGLTKGLILGVKNGPTPGSSIVTMLDKGAVVRLHAPASARSMTMVPS